MLTSLNLLIFRNCLSFYQTRCRISLTSSSIKFNIMMKKLIDSKQYRKALDLFDKQSQDRSDISINMALKASTKLSDYQRGISIHRQLSSHSLNNPFIQTSLVHFYMQCHDIDNAIRLFSTIVNKSNYTYATMFKGFISNKMPEKALDLFDEMKIEPNEVTLNVLFNACAQLRDHRAIIVGKKLLDQMPKNFQNSNTALNPAMHMLMKFGDVTRAEHIFELIKKKDIFSYSIMIGGYVENQIPEKALDLFEKMSVTPDDIIYIVVFNACAHLSDDRAKKIGRKLLDKISKNIQNNEILLNSAIHMLLTYGDVPHAEHLFQMAKKKGIDTYGTMMKAFNLNDEPLKCLTLFQEMKQQDIIPNDIIFLLLIRACSQIGMLSICQSVVAQIPLNFYDNLRIRNSLINMWGKAGSMENAQQVFKSIKNPVSVSYNTMINTFGLNRMGLEAIDLYRKLPDNLHDEVSDICVLNACSHSGLLSEARSIFNEILNKTKRVVTIMIDCLSRLFLFDEAQKLIDDYEKSNSPYLVMYMAILSGARNARNSLLSEQIYKRMKLLFPNEKDALVSASILLCNTYSSLGDHQQAEDIRLNRIKEFGKKVKPGVSWTEVNGEIVQFRAHDRSHPRSKEIHDEMKRISDELIQYGYKYDSSWITRQIDEDESVESILCGHSEKLAIAFHFIQQSKPSLIQITKNLRVCGDCHQITKLIAKIRQCKIIVRDANCVHHFYPNGTCSCQDHF